MGLSFCSNSVNEGNNETPAAYENNGRKYTAHSRVEKCGLMLSHALHIKIQIRAHRGCGKFQLKKSMGGNTRYNVNTHRKTWREESDFTDGVCQMQSTYRGPVVGTSSRQFGVLHNHNSSFIRFALKQHDIRVKQVSSTHGSSFPDLSDIQVFRAPVKGDPVYVRINGF